jgi:hypothetical protein
MGHPCGDRLIVFEIQNSGKNDSNRSAIECKDRRCTRLSWTAQPVLE